MSLRGFKIDREATSHVQFLDKRSFMSQIKQIGPHGGVHFVLYGKDKVAMRVQIFERNRQANGGMNRCVKCGIRVYDVAANSAGYAEGEWHHVRNKPGTRCDCPENGQVWCGPCHRGVHPQVRWTAQEQAIQ